MSESIKHGQTARLKGGEQAVKPGTMVRVKMIFGQGKVSENSGNFMSD